MTNSGGSSRTGRTAPLRKRFRLAGPSVALDPAIFPVRPDLASVALADRVFAPHYAEPVRYRVVAQAVVRAGPDSTSPALVSLVPGDAFEVLDISGGWAWGQIPGDGPVGYLPADAAVHP